MIRSVVLLMGHRKVGVDDELDYRLKDRGFCCLAKRLSKSAVLAQQDLSPWSLHPYRNIIRTIFLFL
jgi:hypothetical protein